MTASRMSLFKKQTTLVILYLLNFTFYKQKIYL